MLGALSIIFNFLGKQGYLGNLYPNVRGGIPRGIGLVPFIILSFYMLPKFNNLVLIIGIFAFIDDIHNFMGLFLVVLPHHMAKTINLY